MKIRSLDVDWLAAIKKKKKTLYGLFPNFLLINVQCKNHNELSHSRNGKRLFFTSLLKATGTPFQLQQIYRRPADVPDVDIKGAFR